MKMPKISHEAMIFLFWGVLVGLMIVIKIFVVK